MVCQSGGKEEKQGGSEPEGKNQKPFDENARHILSRGQSLRVGIFYATEEDKLDTFYTGRTGWREMEGVRYEVFGKKHRIPIEELQEQG